MSELTTLTRRLGYAFQDEKLLRLALSHRSSRGDHNERLEFLGDSLLNFIISQYLFTHFAHASEGNLSRVRASLVKGETLAAIAKDFEIGLFLRLGIGERKSGGRERDSILADTLEAIIAAIYLDSDLKTTEHCVLQWFMPRLKLLSVYTHAKDAKTQLQEYLQSQKMSLPTYEIIKTTGQAHAKTFYIACKVQGSEIIIYAQGHNRRQAEQKAAADFLQKLLNK